MVYHKTMRSFSKSAKVFYRANKSLILSSVFVLLLFGGVWFWYYQKTAPARERARIPRQQEQVAEIVRSGDLERCRQFDGKIINGNDYGRVCRNNIFLQAAFKQLDFSTCDKLMTGYSPDDCKKTVIEKLIESKASADVCLQLSDDLKSFCQDRFIAVGAKNAKTIAACDGMSGPSAKNQCQGNVLLNILKDDGKKTNCSLFDGDIKSQCVTVVGALNGSKSDIRKRQLQCASIPNIDIAGYCEQTVQGLVQ